MPITEQTYERVALEDVDGQWELTRCHELRRKPEMTTEHNRVAWLLAMSLQTQLPVSEFEVRYNAGRLRHPDGAHYIPDVMVMPAEAVRVRRTSRGLERYSEPLPLVVEVWSPSTVRYDLNEKLDACKERGDLEIWFIHPYKRTLQGWQRQPDGSYHKFACTSGDLSPAHLPTVTIRFESLFE